VHFIETSIFTKQIDSLLVDADYRRFQITLALNPEAGDIIRGSGGLRKIRWSAQGRGKRGGIRIIYYLIEDDEIYLLLAYPKNKQEDLTHEQLRILRNLVNDEIS
jgi:mRNA-degrading endonuclease RelE of RelBE toxin-antitoxin system